MMSKERFLNYLIGQDGERFDIDTKDDKGNSLVWYAAYYHLPERLRDLIEMGAATNDCNDAGQSVWDAIFLPIESAITLVDEDGYVEAEYNPDALDKQDISEDMLRCLLVYCFKGKHINHEQHYEKISFLTKKYRGLRAPSEVQKLTSIILMLKLICPAESLEQRSKDIEKRMFLLLRTYSNFLSTFCWFYHVKNITDYFALSVQKRYICKNKSEPEKKLASIVKILDELFKYHKNTPILLELMGISVSRRTPLQEAFCSRLLQVLPALYSDLDVAISLILTHIHSDPAMLCSEPLTLNKQIIIYLCYGVLTEKQQNRLKPVNAIAPVVQGKINVLFYFMHWIIVHSDPQTAQELSIFLALTSMNYNNFTEEFRHKTGYHLIHSNNYLEVRSLDLHRLLRKIRRFCYIRLMDSAGLWQAATQVKQLYIELPANNEKAVPLNDNKQLQIVIYKPSNTL